MYPIEVRFSKNVERISVEVISDGKTTEVETSKLASVSVADNHPVDEMELNNSESPIVFIYFFISIA